MPYLSEGRNCFRCEHLGASLDSYICNKGFESFRGSHGTRTIWTGDLALICPMFEQRRPAQAIEAPSPSPDQ